MPSYNKAKLLLLLEQRRAAGLNMRDLSERYRDANTEKALARSNLNNETRGYLLPSGFMDRLLTLSADEAFSLSADELDSYSAVNNGETRHYKTGIGFATYRRYINARDKAARLSDALESARGVFDERFGVIPSLLDAVQSWGFSNPELEV